MEKLIYLFSNPYTWLFIVFTMGLPYLLKYMRRLFPQKLQDQMAKEEACFLEGNQKPEIKRIHRNMHIGIFISLVTSFIVSYCIDNTFHRVYVIFMSITSVVVIYSGIAEHKVKKDKKNCSDIYDKREFFTQIGIYGGLVVLLIFIIVYF
jgi:hypothetical protein